jgi:superfamily II DNA or RNA helicase
VFKATLSYDKGTIIIRGLAHIPFGTLDPRNNVLRAQALYYANIVEYLKQSGIEFADYVFSDMIASPHLKTIDGDNDKDIDYDDSVTKHIEGLKRGASSASTIASGASLSTTAVPISSDSHSFSSSASSPITSLRDYQHKALTNWVRAGMRGCIVLPTGSGKTAVGIKAIEKVNTSSLIVVPTLDLMDQWTSLLSKHFEYVTKTKIKVGNLGGGTDDIQPITVSTYDSAYLRASLLGNKFLLVIFDEVHHLAAPGYRTIAEQMAAPYRLGLTATIEREDELHKDLPRLAGDIVYQASLDFLAKKNHLASYEIEQRRVELLPDEQRVYRESMSAYRRCLYELGRGRMGEVGNSGGGHNYHHYNVSLDKLIMMSGKNPIAREALLARNKAINIALNSKAKIEELKEILAENPGKKTIIFTQHNSLVYQISNKFLIPFITYKTKKEERQDVLKGFKEGRYMAIVTSKVLDEGVDVPDAQVGVIVSGTGSGREFIQRLGRLLRPKLPIRETARSGNNKYNDGEENDKNHSNKAKLIEIISSETTEETITSMKRNRALKLIRQQNNNWDEREERKDKIDSNNKSTLQEQQNRKKCKSQVIAAEYRSSNDSSDSAKIGE